MIFHREIFSQLESWRDQEKHKPLIVRGARQVGKTTVIKMFGQTFNQFIYLNLESLADRKLFEQQLDIRQLLQLILLTKNITQNTNESLLIFIDEIQNSSAAVAILRYFYEDCPDVHVIAASSLLETLIDTHISFPVGRVEYLFLYPLTFEEFLQALEEKNAFELLQQKTVPDFAHEKLMGLFQLYTMMGGMPEIIASYVEFQNWGKLNSIYESLFLGYQDDVEKYAKNTQQAQVIRHVISHAPFQAGSRITFQNFGQSNYRSKEIGEAMRILEKSMLIQLIYPTTALKPPFEPNHKKSPRLQFLDTGMLNFAIGLQKEFFTLKDLNNIYQGKITEHIVGQQLLGSRTVKQLLFWIREKPQSTAEVDFVIPNGSQLIPVEIKSGKTGTLRSLHSFMALSENNAFAIRLYGGKFSRDTILTPTGKTFELLNLPYYLSGQLKKIIE